MKGWGMFSTRLAIIGWDWGVVKQLKGWIKEVEKRAGEVRGRGREVLVVEMKKKMKRREIGRKSRRLFRVMSCWGLSLFHAFAIEVMRSIQQINKD